jgi:sn-glycerol 3-phosphate transport system substrate-binding protein
VRALRPLALVVLLAGCASGKSILDAGNEPVATTTTAVPVTAAPGSTLPPTTPPTIATTTTTPLASLPPCPVDTLDSVTSPVPITVWYPFGSVQETTLNSLTDEYNASQSKVHVTLENQTGYQQEIEKYNQSSQDSRPNIAILPEYMVQAMADSDSVVPVGACMEADDFDTSSFLPRALLQYQTEGVQWSLPFNVSSPVLFFNQAAFRAAGLDPGDPPLTLDELRATSQQLVSSGAVKTGIAFDSGSDSGGGWFLEQWLAKAGELYADNGNGRQAPATKVLFDGPTGVELLTFVQSMINDGLAVTVGDNPNGSDALLRLANRTDPAAMAIASSAGIGPVKGALDGGLIPGITSADLGVGPMPGPGDTPSANVGGASLYIMDQKGDAATAASWDYIKFLTSAQSQSTWAAATGYVPVRQDALALDPVKTTYATDPRFEVPYDQLSGGVEDFASVGPVLGPLPQIRTLTAAATAAIMGGADVQTQLTAAAQQADALITQYNQLNG